MTAIAISQLMRLVIKLVLCQPLIEVVTDAFSEPCLGDELALN